MGLRSELSRQVLIIDQYHLLEPVYNQTKDAFMWYDQNIYVFSLLTKENVENHKKGGKNYV